MAEVELPNAEELEEMRSKSFTRMVALTTAVYAVLLAITSLGGNNAMKEMLLSQQQSSDQWAFYQSKVLREHLYRTNGLQIESLLLERGASMNSRAKKKYDDQLREMRAEEARYSREKKKIEDDAKSLEVQRDKNQAKDPYFDYAEVLLQISIVLASIAILAVSRPVYYFSIVSACSGSMLMLNGYFLLVRIPFFQ